MNWKRRTPWTDELIYTYQLYFYQKYSDDSDDKVTNNEYGTEYVINKKQSQSEI